VTLIAYRRGEVNFLTFSPSLQSALVAGVTTHLPERVSSSPEGWHWNKQGEFRCRSEALP
jgi:hypothetical protein